MSPSASSLAASDSGGVASDDQTPLVGGAAAGVRRRERERPRTAAGSGCMGVGLPRVRSHALFLDPDEGEELGAGAERMLVPKQISLAAGSLDLLYDMGCHALQGVSSKMEDRVLMYDLSYHPHFSGCRRAVLVAVLDGHAGSDAVSYLEANLAQHVLEEVACQIGCPPVLEVPPQPPHQHHLHQNHTNQSSNHHNYQARNPQNHLPQGQPMQQQPMQLAPPQARQPLPQEQPSPPLPPRQPASHPPSEEEQLLPTLLQQQQQRQAEATPQRQGKGRSEAEQMEQGQQADMRQSEQGRQQRQQQQTQQQQHLSAPERLPPPPLQYTPVTADCRDAVSAAADCPAAAAPDAAAAAAVDADAGAADLEAAAAAAAAAESVAAAPARPGAHNGGSGGDVAGRMLGHGAWGEAAGGEGRQMDAPAAAAANLPVAPMPEIETLGVEAAATPAHASPNLSVEIRTMGPRRSYDEGTSEVSYGWDDLTPTAGEYGEDDCGGADGDDYADGGEGEVYDEGYGAAPPWAASPLRHSAAELWRRTSLEAYDSGCGCKPPDPPAVLRNALLRCERELMDLDCHSGSTALVGLMLGSGLWLANVGDCRAVVCDDGEARQLTVDHKAGSGRPDAPGSASGGAALTERLRLLSLGAQLSADGYLQVTGPDGSCSDLAVSRNLGCAHLKNRSASGRGSSSSSWTHLAAATPPTPPDTSFSTSVCAPPFIPAQPPLYGTPNAHNRPNHHKYQNQQQQQQHPSSGGASPVRAHLSGAGSAAVAATARISASGLVAGAAAASGSTGERPYRPPPHQRQQRPAPKHASAPTSLSGSVGDPPGLRSLPQHPRRDPPASHGRAHPHSHPAPHRYPHHYQRQQAAASAPGCPQASPQQQPQHPHPHPHPQHQHPNQSCGSGGGDGGSGYGAVYRPNHRNYHNHQQNCFGNNNHTRASSEQRCSHGSHTQLMRPKEVAFGGCGRASSRSEPSILSHSPPQSRLLPPPQQQAQQQQAQQHRPPRPAAAGLAAGLSPGGQPGPRPSPYPDPTASCSQAGSANRRPNGRGGSPASGAGASSPAATAVMYDDSTTTAGGPNGRCHSVDGFGIRGSDGGGGGSRQLAVSPAPPGLPRISTSLGSGDAVRQPPPPHQQEHPTAPQGLSPRPPEPPSSCGPSGGGDSGGLHSSHSSPRPPPSPSTAWPPVNGSSAVSAAATATSAGTSARCLPSGPPHAHDTGFAPGSRPGCRTGSGFGHPIPTVGLGGPSVGLPPLPPSPPCAPSMRGYVLSQNFYRRRRSGGAGGSGGGDHSRERSPSPSSSFTRGGGGGSSMLSPLVEGGSSGSGVGGNSSAGASGGGGLGDGASGLHSTALDGVAADAAVTIVAAAAATEQLQEASAASVFAAVAATAGGGGEGDGGNSSGAAAVLQTSVTFSCWTLNSAFVHSVPTAELAAACAAQLRPSTAAAAAAEFTPEHSMRAVGTPACKVGGGEGEGSLTSLGVSGFGAAGSDDVASVGCSSAAGVLIPDPDLFYYHISQDSEFLICACDGLWDVMRNTEACRYVRRWLADGSSAAAAAESLCRAALKMGSHDNISAVVLRFSSRPLPCAPSTSRIHIRRATSQAVLAA